VAHERPRRGGQGKPGTLGAMGKTPRRRHLEQAEIDDFDHIADALLGRVRLVRTNLLPPAADGMTIGRFVLLRGNHIRESTSPLLAHELVHVRQFAEMGAPRFLGAYFGAYFKNLRRTKNHRQAYLDIPLEQEAREVAAEWLHARQANNTNER
jgi:hypothetical protein